MVEAIGIRQSKPSEKEFDALEKFLLRLFEVAENGKFDDFQVRQFICRNAHLEGSVGRVLWGGRTAIANACDPACDTLEWKPEIAEAIARPSECPTCGRKL